MLSFALAVAIEHSSVTLSQHLNDEVIGYGYGIPAFVRQWCNSGTSLLIFNFLGRMFSPPAILASTVRT